MSEIYFCFTGLDFNAIVLVILQVPVQGFHIYPSNYSKWEIVKFDAFLLYSDRIFALLMYCMKCISI